MFKLPIDELSHYRLQTLRDTGFRPRTILDIGACKGDWTREIRGLFPESRVFMVEGNGDCQGDLDRVGVPYEIALLSDEVKTVEFHKHRGRYTTGDSIYKERTSAYEGDSSYTETRECRTLAEVVASRGVVEVDFVKIDVQGSERDVIAGGLEVVRGAEVVLLELQLLEYNAGAPMFAEMVVYMESIGFQVYDVTELHYTPRHVLVQLDLLFVHKDSDLSRRVLG